MRSIQFNYFAADSDLVLVAETILNWESDIVIFPARGLERPLKGTLVRESYSLIPKSNNEMHFLCAEYDAQNVRTVQVDRGICCIRVQENPVVEYSPSAPMNDDMVKIGRFYANYDDANFMKRVKELFRQLERRAVQLDDSGVWIFPSAARTKRILKMWAGQDWENPFLINAS